MVGAEARPRRLSYHWVATVSLTIALCNAHFGSGRGPLVEGWVLRIRGGSDGLGQEPIELDQHAGDLAGGDQTAGVAR